MIFESSRTLFAKVSSAFQKTIAFKSDRETVKTRDLGYECEKRANRSLPLDAARRPRAAATCNAFDRKHSFPEREQDSICRLSKDHRQHHEGDINVSLSLAFSTEREREGGMEKGAVFGGASEAVLGDGERVGA